MNILKLCILFIFLPLLLLSQVNFTANDQVFPYQTPFLFGVNPGYYNGWDDEGLADVVVGNPAFNLRGAGVESQRLFLPHDFLEEWGYDVRIDELEYFESIGLKEHTVTIGFPSEEQRDTTHFCSEHRSELFTNMYLPIWNNGGINEDNYFANYIYQLATKYKSLIKIYEVWNEPDFDYSGNGFKDSGEPGNWFENIPAPCDIHIRAPIFHYIRLLRITYEVVKTIDPEAYVAVGGLGYVSFLDLILRHTDNPDQGNISNEFPLNGGAYFDVMSFHSYPHFDGALRYWSNDINDFVYTRHSDAAAQGVIDKKDEYSELLKSYGYNDAEFPKKIFINTESNLPRVAFDDFIGSDAAQTNFLMKMQVACRKNKIKQFHVFKTGESRIEEEMTSPFHAMGFFKDLEAVAPYEQIENECVLASATTTHFLKDKKFDEEATAELNLPADVNGGFFCGGGACIIVLWAKTTTDQSEIAQANYALPSGLEISELERFEWDYLDNPSMEVNDPTNLSLNGRPSFFLPKYLSTTTTTLKDKVHLYPNQLTAGANINISSAQKGRLELINSNGQIVFQSALNTYFTEIELPSDFGPGYYFARMIFEEGEMMEKIAVLSK